MTLSDEQRLTEAQHAFQHYYAQCFWYSDPALRIEQRDVAWIAAQLRKYGDSAAQRIAARLDSNELAT